MIRYFQPSMIQRIVKLTFKEEHAEEFAQFFTEVKTRIESNKGCNEVRLLRDVNNRNIFFTYSFINVFYILIYIEIYF